MPRINGRSLEQVRRYDLFKLVVAVLLFIAWLFFTDRMPMGPSSDGPADSTAGVATDVAPPPAADILPAPIRIESFDGRIRLHGSVPDEATRDDYVAAARKALGRDRVDDHLSVVAGVGRPDWISHAGPAIGALAGHDGVSAMIDAQQVVIEGGVADEAQRTSVADAVTAAFGAPFTVVNRLVIVEPAAGSAVASGVAATTAIAALPASATTAGSVATGSGTAGSGIAGSAPPLQIAPAPVSIFFEEGVTVVSSGDEEKLTPLARHARDAGVALRVSGFHSKTGSAQRNAEIAKERAVSVRDLLVGLGVATDRVLLDKPQETLGEEDDRRARRVDVGIDG